MPSSLKTSIGTWVLSLIWDWTISVSSAWTYPTTTCMSLHGEHFRGNFRYASFISFTEAAGSTHLVSKSRMASSAKQEMMLQSWGGTCDMPIDIPSQQLNEGGTFLSRSTFPWIWIRCHSFCRKQTKEQAMHFLQAYLEYKQCLYGLFFCLHPCRIPVDLGLFFHLQSCHPDVLMELTPPSTAHLRWRTGRNVSQI